MTTKTRTIAQITKGRYKGAIVKPCTDSMDCPFFSGANDETISVVHIIENGEQGLILALKDNELRWL
jgi:hypothetical protein